jgi:hypothetical protein
MRPTVFIDGKDRYDLAFLSFDRCATQALQQLGRQFFSQ